MQCACCKELVDDDSCYCDMCGEEIRFCARCKKTGKGKVCTSCGTPLIIIKSQADAAIGNGTYAGAQIRLPSGGKYPEPIVPAGIRRLPDNEPVKSAVPQLRLLNKNINVDLKIDDNSIIGRTTGQYQTTFGSFDQVSSRHCYFNYDPAKGWCVTDLGSTNKTKYNNLELTPNSSQVINDQTFLKIANIEFFVRVIPS